jgi:hypothetical protein
MLPSGIESFGNQRCNENGNYRGQQCPRTVACPLFGKLLYEFSHIGCSLA